MRRLVLAGMTALVALLAALGGPAGAQTPTEPLGRLIITKIKVDAPIAEGVTGAALSAGVGHYPHTPMPGDLGNAGLAGHRAVAPAVLARLNQLVIGDEIVVRRPSGDVTFKVDSVAVLPTSDPAILAQATVPVLTLTAAEGDGASQVVVRGVRSDSSATAVATTLAPLAVTPPADRPKAISREGGESAGSSVYYGVLVLVVLLAGLVHWARTRRT